MKNLDGKLLSIKQKGFTIVELMIAGTLGIILIAGVIQLFTGSNRSFSMQEELAKIQENGRFALILLENEIQKGGWVDNFNLDPPNAINLTNSSDGLTDSIAIAYATVIDGVANRDCNGALVADGRIENRFYVGGANGDELLCQGNGGGAAQPLISGVTNFQVLYGVETNTACPDAVVNQYITKTDAVAAGNSVILVSVRVSLLLSSDKNVRPAVKVDTHQLLDTAWPTADRLAHRLFQQTISMPNSIYNTIGNPQMAIDCLRRGL